MSAQAPPVSAKMTRYRWDKVPAELIDDDFIAAAEVDRVLAERAVCPHCHLPAVLPALCTPAVNDAINEGLARNAELFEAGRQHGIAHANEEKARVLAERDEQKEICICAAVQLPCGTVIRGHRHPDAMRTAADWWKHQQKSEKWPVLRIEQDMQGFVTSHGRFVGRVEAMNLQLAAGVKSAYSKDGELHGTLLFSEDLY